jgi:hypothetical protein
MGVGSRRSNQRSKTCESAKQNYNHRRHTQILYLHGNIGITHDYLTEVFDAMIDMFKLRRRAMPVLIVVIVELLANFVQAVKVMEDVEVDEKTALGVV